ncbi:MAG: hypothetical protein ACREN4_08040 [Candidatus Dormibacteria bacterium]
MSRRIKRVLLEHSRLLLDPDYLEERCQALVISARRYGKDRNLVVHEPDLACCRVEGWRVTERLVTDRALEIAKETKPNPRRGVMPMPNPQERIRPVPGEPSRP